MAEDDIYTAGDHDHRTATALVCVAASALAKAERRLGRTILVSPSVAAYLWVKAFRDRDIPYEADALAAVAAVDTELRGDWDDAVFTAFRRPAT